MKNKDLNWYLKWIATVILITGTAVNSLGFFPAGPIILALGGVVWLIVSIRWKEPALIATNGIMLATGVAGLCISYFCK